MSFPAPGRGEASDIKRLVRQDSPENGQANRSLCTANSASGTYGFFKEHAMLNGDYKPTVQPGSSSVVQGVSSDLGGIGYSGVVYKTSGVKAIPLGKAAESSSNPLMRIAPQREISYFPLSLHLIALWKSERAFKAGV